MKYWIASYQICTKIFVLKWRKRKLFGSFTAFMVKFIKFIDCAWLKPWPLPCAGQQRIAFCNKNLERKNNIIRQLNYHHIFWKTFWWLFVWKSIWDGPQVIKSITDRQNTFLKKAWIWSQWPMSASACQRKSVSNVVRGNHVQYLFFSIAGGL